MHSRAIRGTASTSALAGMCSLALSACSSGRGDGVALDKPAAGAPGQTLGGAASELAADPAGAPLGGAGGEPRNSNAGGASDGGSAGVAQGGDAGAGGMATQPEDPLTVLFDGSNLDNWVYDDHTKLVDGILTIDGCWCLALTEQDYDNFRLIVSSRVRNTNDFGNDHNGIAFWGQRVVGDYTPRRSFMIVPLNCWTWDYKRNTSKAPGQTGSCDDSGALSFDEWNTTEVLVNLNEGTIKSALNGVKQFDLKLDVAAGGWVKGPIGLQDHGSNLVEYKDVKIEVNPVDQNLITLSP